MMVSKRVQWVYRIERERDGRGPYFDYDWQRQLPLGHYGSGMGYDYEPARQPVPYADGLANDVWYPQAYRFGFVRRVQILKWFDAVELRALHGTGYVIAKYEAREVYLGGHQCVFCRFRLERRYPIPRRWRGDLTA